MIKLIGISGKRGTGKSLLAVNLEDYGFDRISLAGELKERCIIDFGLGHHQVYGCDKERPTGYKRTDGSPLTSRDIMIRMGVFYRSIDPLYWCKALDKTIALRHNDKFVIDDIRFLNEINYFKSKYGAKFVRIEREEAENPYRAALDDLSETELDTYKDWDLKLIKELNHTPKDLKEFSKFVADHLHVSERLNTHANSDEGY